MQATPRFLLWETLSVFVSQYINAFLPTMNVNTSEWREKIKIHRGEILSFHSFCDDCYQIADFIAAQKTFDMGLYSPQRIRTEVFYLMMDHELWR